MNYKITIIEKNNVFQSFFMSRTIRFLFLAIFIFFNLNTLIAQDRKDYGLLWEIKHKDSNKKSYLFGTIHVKDNRAFQFSDSVIPAIKNSEMFALEINPDSVYTDFGRNYVSKESENVFKKILSKEDYERLKVRFQKVNKTDLDSFPISHPQLIESMLTKEQNKPDDRRTFLDAYLYGIAFNNNKEITGLEKIEDQIPLQKDLDEKDLKKSILNILDSSGPDLNKQLEELILIYYDGNIDNILNYVDSFGPADKIMVSRNNVMVNSLDKIMQNKTVFAAVGTAHLPGKNGMLELLTKKGYTVRKMGASFNDEEQQFAIKPNTDRWQINTDESLGYSVLTPTKPIPLKIGDNYEMLTSTDLIFGGTFHYMVLDLRNQNLKEGFDFEENIIKGQLKDSTYSVLKRKTFLIDSVPFTEVFIQKEKSVSRMQFTLVNKIIYTFFSESSLEEVTSPYADAFFNSIKIITPKVEPSVWRNKTDSIGAYSIRIPEAELDRSYEAPNPNGSEESPYVLNIFSSEDKAKNTIYLFRYNDQPVGYYLNQKDDYYIYFEDFFKERGTPIGEPKNITMDGAEGKEYELLFSDKYHTIAKLFLRGNRTYLLMAQTFNESEKIAEDDEFFSSFKLLPYADASFDTIVNIDEYYSFKAPSEKVVIEAESVGGLSEYGYIKNYSSLDLKTSGTYLVQQSKLKPYVRKKSLQAFYDDYIEVLTDYNDSLTSNIPTTMAGKPAREIRMQNSDTDVKQRMKLLLDDDTIVLFLTYLGDEEINEPRVDEFFNSFEIKKKSNKFDLTDSKADLIFKDLKSKDSTKFIAAKGALSYYDFDASEYKILKKNLNKRYADDTLTYGVKYYIINALTSLEKPETLKTLTDFYKKEKNSYNGSLEALEQILMLKNSEAAATYFDLLENHKPERISDNPYEVLSTLSDTIPLFIANDARFSKLADIDDYRDQLSEIYVYNISGDSLNGDKMPLFKNKLISHLYKDSQLYIDTIARKNNDYLTYSLISSYIKLSKDIGGKNPEVSKTLKLLSENIKKDGWLRAEALITSVKLDIEIDPKIWNEALEDLYSRFELMEGLVDAEKTEMIPEEYLQPKEFAKLSLYNTAGEEYDEYPSAFNFLGETIVDDKCYYTFTYSFGEDKREDEQFLGVVEETAIDFSNFKLANVYLDWESVEENWQTQATKIIKEATNSEDSIIEE
ncbi:hypothetical protein Aeqsu_3052 [Aequorivita sublithincola DSM 14238]|uniref:TraB/GumN family protein n=1 Tax=Aequorivita sublithincola (strain DSM 14238 / LMG 21431 / ACAM 643 / 9-3) TaxID=746697 RepID=I3YZS2_AEQSU|nr:TraB/GumN family protein [Aequorivita sublithincola]AFL82490.1 hypothetical protein Aeqsu_3052 [Aequorivita sublithincola DSM 14238]